MVTSKSDIWTMLHITGNVFDSFQTIWQNDSKFSEDVQAYYKSMTDIENIKIKLTNVSSKSFTKEKALALNNLENQALFLINRIKSYATVVGNNNLFFSMKFNKSTFENESDNLILSDITILLAIAKQHLSDLQPFAVTQDLITKLQTQVITYADICSAPNELMKMLHERFTQSINNTLVVLQTRLDFEIEIYKSSAPVFYREYIKARKIIENIGTVCSVSVSVSITSEDSNEVLEGVCCDFIVYDEIIPIISKESDTNGDVRILHLAQGKYNVRISKTGYKDQTIQIVVTQGETTQLTIVMESLSFNF